MSGLSYVADQGNTGSARLRAGGPREFVATLSGRQIGDTESGQADAGIANTNAVPRRLIDAAVAGAGRTVGAVAHLPMAGRKSFWTVGLDPVTAEVLALIPLDPY